MSESSKDNPKTSLQLQRIRLFIIMIVAVVIILGIGYVSGYFILPGLIKSAYQNKNCESVLSREDIYTSIYPSIITNKALVDPVRECAIYTLALANEDRRAWHDSYNTFNVYAQTYPDGLFILEAHEHSAVVLTSLAKDAMAHKKYAETMGNLNLISVDYNDTKVATDAANLIPEVYTAWGIDLRNSGDFVGAEKIFNEFNAWAQSGNKTENVNSAQHELAQTYLAWGLDLQSQKEFEDAKSKLDIAISSDPEPQSNSGPAAQAKASQVKLYTQWGDYLIEQKDFANAMGYYATAAKLSESENPASASDIIASGYIQWASGLTVQEDYFGALVLLDFAQASVATDLTKTSVDTARSDLYLAFSKSSSEQAQKAMMDAVKIVCEHHTQPSLPIFGLDSENVLAGIYGVDESLPENVAATTPSSLHYVACVEEDSKIASTTTYPISTRAFNPNASPGVVNVQFVRTQYLWNIILRETGTGKEIEATLIEGDDPPPIPANYFDHIRNPFYFGPKPDVVILADWLLTVMK